VLWGRDYGGRKKEKRGTGKKKRGGGTSMQEAGGIVDLEQKGDMLGKKTKVLESRGKVGMARPAGEHVGKQVKRRGLLLGESRI